MLSPRRGQACDRSRRVQSFSVDFRLGVPGSGYASVSVALAESHTPVPGRRARSATAAEEMSTSAGGLESTWTRTRSASSSREATLPFQTLRGLAWAGRVGWVVVADGGD